MADDSDYEDEFGTIEKNIGLYEGERSEIGERHGKGKASFPNGDVYEGEYSNGKRNGLGTYRFKSAKYHGEYIDGRRHGDGLLNYPDGSMYDGHWEDNDKSGVGRYTYPNGDVYHGGWKDDQKHGKGVYTYAETGTVFKGHWVEGTREGPAEWINQGHSYKGYFHKDHPFGRGRFVFDNGCEQHGYYKITNLVEQVDKVMELVGQETRWTCTSLLCTLPSSMNEENKAQK